MSHKDIYGYKDTYGYIWMYGYGYKDMDIRIYIWLELKSTHAINIFFLGSCIYGWKSADRTKPHFDVIFFVLSDQSASYQKSILIHSFF